MDVSLLTLLRREDVSALRFADARDGALWVMPAKTAESTGVRLQIAMSDDLAALLARCRDAVVSPYVRSEEHTSELQSLMRISYAVFCLKKKNRKHNEIHTIIGKRNNGRLQTNDHNIRRQDK